MLKRILVLDDNQDILDIVKEALSYEKFKVSVTTDSEHIFDDIMAYQPDLVMLDYKTSGPKGDDICRRIKTHPLFNNIPVIICSAYLDQSINLLTCGCDALIAKPFGLDELVYKVSNLIVN
jgi:DNA-binding response OmpR family regulator